MPRVALGLLLLLCGFSCASVLAVESTAAQKPCCTPRWTWLRESKLVLLQEHAVFDYIIEAISKELTFLGIPHSIEDGHSAVWSQNITYLSAMLLATRPRPPRYIIYNFEQLVTNSGYFGPRILRQLQNAIEVWDYSMVNVAFLQQSHNIRTRFVPLSFTPAMQQFSAESRPRPVDVSFVGCMNDRRERMLEGLQRAYSKAPGRMFTTPNGCSVSGGCYGKCMIKLYNSSRVGINMHYYKGRTVLEVHRILPYIANRVIIVSERSTDAWYDGFFANVITFFTNTSDMERKVAAITRLSRRDYDQLVDWRYELFRSLPSYSDFLRRAICVDEGELTLVNRK